MFDCIKKQLSQSFHSIAPRTMSSIQELAVVELPPSLQFLASLVNASCSGSGSSSVSVSGACFSSGS